MGVTKYIPEREPTEVDWAKLAAYIDGEGCITITEGHNKKLAWKFLYVTVCVTNTDPRLTAWVAKTFGGRVYGHNNNAYKSRKPNWAPCFYWSVACRQARAILEGCLPHFVLKREQAEIAIEFAKTLGGPGKPVTTEVLGKRYELKSSISRLNSRKGGEGKAHLYVGKYQLSTGNQRVN